jgi:hypothetical protein
MLLKELKNILTIHYVQLKFPEKFLNFDLIDGEYMLSEVNYGVCKTYEMYEAYGEQEITQIGLYQDKCLVLDIEKRLKHSEGKLNTTELNKIELKINNYRDRDNVVIALVNAGYTVKIREEKTSTGLLTADYFIQIVNEKSNI